MSDSVILNWENDPILTCDVEDCGFMTGIPQEAIDHAIATRHSVSGPGRLEGTTLTVSIEESTDEEA